MKILLVGEFSKIGWADEGSHKKYSPQFSTTIEIIAEVTGLAKSVIETFLKTREM